MPAKKFLRLVAGVFTEVAATVTSAGAGNDGDLVALDSSGRLDNSVMPVGIGVDTKTIAASEALAAGSASDEDYLKTKLVTAKFYMERIMPETALRKARIETGADTMMELAAEAF